ncbi:hypothetical protein YPPY56_4325, partial [Yersinia pestis PY-56]
MSCLQADVAK